MGKFFFEFLPILFLRINFTDSFKPLFNSLLYSRLLITFANSLDPDQDRQNVGPDPGPNHLTVLKVFMKELLKKLKFEKKSLWTTTKALSITQHAKS